jgi:hypothetical protein
MRNAHKILVEISEGKIHLKDLDIDGRLIFKLILKKYGMRMTVFWDVVPRSMIDIDRRFRIAYCLHHLESHKI